MKTLFSKMKLLIIMTLIGFMQVSIAKNNDDVSLEEASETIRKETKGQVLSAKTNRYNGVKSHRIQVLTESGRVKVYQVPANKKDVSRHYGNNKPPNNSNKNYRDIKSSNSQNKKNTRNIRNKPSQSRTKFNRSNYNRGPTPAPTKPSSSKGETKKQ